MAGKRATLTKLRLWHRQLSRAHSIACAVADAAEECGDLDSDERIILADPIIELHAALSQIEGLIDAALTPRIQGETK